VNVNDSVLVTVAVPLFVTDGDNVPEPLPVAVFETEGDSDALVVIVGERVSLTLRVKLAAELLLLV
jgi:hypothetical protein